jgi:hypothetical protein
VFLNAKNWLTPVVVVKMDVLDPFSIERLPVGAAKADHG